MIEQNDYRPRVVEVDWPTDEGPIATLRQALNLSFDDELAIVNHDGLQLELQFPDFVAYAYEIEELCDRLVFELGVLVQNGWDLYIRPHTAPTEDPDVDDLCVQVLLLPHGVGHRCLHLTAA
jgi:hypothetical protein